MLNHEAAPCKPQPAEAWPDASGAGGWINLDALRHARSMIGGLAISPSEKLILLELAALTNARTGAAWPAAATIGETLGMHRSVVLRGLRNLETAGAVLVDRAGAGGRSPGRGRTHFFRIVGYQPAQPARVDDSAEPEKSAQSARFSDDAEPEKARDTQQKARDMQQKARVSRANPIVIKNPGKEGKETTITEGGEGETQHTNETAAAGKREELRQALTPEQLTLKDELIAFGLGDKASYRIVVNYAPDSAGARHVRAAIRWVEDDMRRRPGEIGPGVLKSRLDRKIPDLYMEKDWKAIHEEVNHPAEEPQPVTAGADAPAEAATETPTPAAAETQTDEPEIAAVIDPAAPLDAHAAEVQAAIEEIADDPATPRQWACILEKPGVTCTNTTDYTIAGPFTETEIRLLDRAGRSILADLNRILGTFEKKLHLKSTLASQEAAGRHPYGWKTITDALPAALASAAGAVEEAAQ